MMLVLAWAVAALAAEPVDPFTEPDESELFRAEQQVVTVASRYAQTVRQAPSIVTVVTAREIRARGYRTLSDVLRSMPGIYISVAKESRDLAWFRGAISSDNNKFLLLIDGVPWYDGVYDHAWIDECVPLVNVRQIEVIKGPGSAIYGTNAFTGVVNVVTYGGEDLRGGFARVEVGTGARRGGAAVYADRVQAKGREAEVRAFARYLETDGDGLEVTPKGRRNVTATDPRRAVNGGLGISLGGLSARLDLVDYRHTYFVNEQDDPLDVMLQSVDEFNLSYHNEFLAARYDIGLGLLGRISPYAYGQRYDNPGSYAWFGDYETEETAEGTHETTWSGTLVETEKLTERYGAGVEAELHPSPDHATVAGAGAEMVYVVQLEDIYFEDFAGLRTEDPTFRAVCTDDADERVGPDACALYDIFGFLQHTWTARYWLEITAGARLDHHNYYGPFLTPRLGILVVPSARGTAKLLYGRAFRAPTARELLVVVGTDSDGGNLFTNGNPDLLPEVIDTVEAEVTVEPRERMQLRAATFFSAIDKEINKVVGDDPELGDVYYDNATGFSAAGAEIQATTRIGAFQGDASYAFTWATYRDLPYGLPSADRSRALQYEFPPHMLHGSLTWDATSFLHLTAMADWYGTRPREAWSPDAGLEDGDPFGLVHLAVATDPLAGGRLEADLSVRNVLDTSYETLVYRDDANALDSDGEPKYPRDIQGDGRSIVAGLEYRF